jgi:hypothetical protein
MKYFLPAVLACSSLLAASLFTPEKPDPRLLTRRVRPGLLFLIRLLDCSRNWRRF